MVRFSVSRVTINVKFELVLVLGLECLIAR